MQASSPEVSVDEDDTTMETTPPQLPRLLCMPASPWSRRRCTSMLPWWRCSLCRRLCQCSSRCKRNSGTTCSSWSNIGWLRAKSMESARARRPWRPWPRRTPTSSQSSVPFTMSSALKLPLARKRPPRRHYSRRLRRRTTPDAPPTRR